MNQSVLSLIISLMRFSRGESPPSVTFEQVARYLFVTYLSGEKSARYSGLNSEAR